MFRRARLVLAAWFTLALAITLVAVGGVAYALIRRDIDREIGDSLATTEQALGSPYQGRGPGDGDSRDGRGDDQYRLPPGIPSDVFIVYTDAAGTVLANPRAVDVDDVNFIKLSQAATKSNVTSDVSTSAGHFRIISQPGGAPGVFIHIGRSLEARDRQLQTLTVVFGVGGFAGLVAAAAGGFWLAGLALRPIRRSFERQQQFVSDASHELRTPLAVLRANGELLQRHRKDTIENNLDQVDAITAEAEAMTKLVEDLLTLARADEGEANLEHEPVSLGAVLEDLGRDMEALANTRQISLSVEAEPVEVIGDRHRLRQLGTILLDNALKYTPSGGNVALRCVRHGKSAEVSVTDTGPGIPAEEQARIFDRFVRVDSARTRAAGGSGLGLAIARWIAEAHGGRIWVESVPGNGSRFVFRVPIAD
ncbi:MAG: ATP-binding protein [bacterium]